MHDGKEEDGCLNGFWGGSVGQSGMPFGLTMRRAKVESNAGATRNVHPISRLIAKAELSDEKDVLYTVIYTEPHYT